MSMIRNDSRDFLSENPVITKGDNFSKTKFAVIPVIQNNHLTH